MKAKALFNGGSSRRPSIIGLLSNLQYLNILVLVLIIITVAVPTA